jgi:hypothetical protein
VRLVAAVLVFCSLAVAVGAQPIQQAPAPTSVSEQPDALTSDKPGAGEPKQATQPPIIVNVLPAPKTDAEAEHERQERAEKAELDRQLVHLTADLASFTAWLVYATAALVVATAGLAIFAYVQARDMKESLAIAKVAADASAKSAGVAERALTTLERAFVYFSRWDLEQLPVREDDPSRPYYCTIRWMNTGRTQAKRFIQYINWKAFDPGTGPDAIGFADLPGPPAFPTMIGPGAEHIGHRHAIGSEYIKAALMGQWVIYVWGWCEYNDVFQGSPRHRTEFCIRLDAMEVEIEGEPGKRRAVLQFRSHAQYNGADEDCLRPVQTG